MSGAHAPGHTLDHAARRLVALRKLARLERREFGSVRASTQRAIVEACAHAEAVCVVDEARTAIARATGVQP